MMLQFLSWQQVLVAQAQLVILYRRQHLSDYTLGGSPTGKTLAFDFGSGYNGHKIKVIATISASVVGAKTKTKQQAKQ